MSLLGNLGTLIKQATSDNASTTDVHASYDQVATAVPPSTLAEGLGHAFKSDQTPPFEQMVSGLFGQSNPDQKAGILNRLLGSLPSGAASQLLGSIGGLGSLAGAVGGTVTPQQAQQVPPEAVQALAQRAAKQDPSIMDKAAGFYAQHPTLVKAIGAGALALLMSKISAGRR